MSLEKYALIGYPLGHSMSPFIHGELFKLSSRTADYRLLEISPESLAVNIGRLREYAGFNVTIPFKRAIIPYLDALDGRAAFYGSVNTVSGGTLLKGYNTDADGFLTALRLNGIKPAGRVVVCGAGGAGRMMAYELAGMGCKVTVAVRRESLVGAVKLRDEISAAINGAAVSAEVLDDLHSDINLLCNATPVGMFPHVNGMPVLRKVLDSTEAVFDAVYNPQETELIKSARKCGTVVCGGMPMLVWQAVYAHKIWYGGEFAEKAVSEIIESANSQMRVM
ncbi:MAG TPA: shikimate dehydrogenase [Ruminococcaceae bacterium]|nr:shikimate dehydrogenase [Oscillospiraceae bacterium]